MIEHPKVVSVAGMTVISFNKGKSLFFIDGKKILLFGFPAILLGSINTKLIVLIKDKYIVSVEFPSLLINKFLGKLKIKSNTYSKNIIWLFAEDIVYFIDNSLSILPYDDFSHTKLCQLTFLEAIDSLMYIIDSAGSYNIIFEDTAIPALILPKTAVIPELIFESTKQITFAVGRSIICYDLNTNSVFVQTLSKRLEFLWQSFKLLIDYMITATTISIISETMHKCHIIEGEIWKIIHFENEIYIFSDSINNILNISKLDQDGELQYIHYGETLTNHLMQLHSFSDHQSCPVLVFSPDPSSVVNSQTAFFFVHGGPHQKSGNTWDYLISGLLKKGYKIYIPQYIGTIGVEKVSEQPLAYGIDDFNEIQTVYNQIKVLHERMVIVGHSYGAFLSLKLFLKTKDATLIGLNGIYDLQTIAELNPKTYKHLDQSTLVIRSPQNSQPLLNKGEWHHIQFLRDPTIPLASLKQSLKRVGSYNPQLHFLDFYGHGLFNQIQAESIINTIQFIINKVNNEKLCEWKHD